MSMAPSIVDDVGDPHIHRSVDHDTHSTVDARPNRPEGRSAHPRRDETRRDEIRPAQLSVTTIGPVAVVDAPAGVTEERVIAQCAEVALGSATTADSNRGSDRCEASKPARQHQS
jgi:hypothetical protein